MTVNLLHSSPSSLRRFNNREFQAEPAEGLLAHQTQCGFSPVYRFIFFLADGYFLRMHNTTKRVSP
jgi:hypothetical protein